MLHDSVAPAALRRISPARVTVSASCAREQACPLIAARQGHRQGKRAGDGVSVGHHRNPLTNSDRAAPALLCLVARSSARWIRGSMRPTVTTAVLLANSEQRQIYSSTAVSRQNNPSRHWCRKLHTAVTTSSREVHGACAKATTPPAAQPW